MVVPFLECNMERTVKFEPLTLVYPLILIYEEFEILFWALDRSYFIVVVHKVSAFIRLRTVIVCAGMIETNPKPFRSDGKVASLGRPDQCRRNMTAIVLR